jgi:hypothetical protein
MMMLLILVPDMLGVRVCLVERASLSKVFLFAFGCCTVAQIAVLFARPLHQSALNSLQSFRAMQTCCAFNPHHMPSKPASLFQQQIHPVARRVG